MQVSPTVVAHLRGSLDRMVYGSGSAEPLPADALEALARAVPDVAKAARLALWYHYRPRPQMEARVKARRAAAQRVPVPSRAEPTDVDVAAERAGMAVDRLADLTSRSDTFSAGMGARYGAERAHWTVRRGRRAGNGRAAMADVDYQCALRSATSVDERDAQETLEAARLALESAEPSSRAAMAEIVRTAEKELATARNARRAAYRSFANHRTARLRAWIRILHRLGYRGRAVAEPDLRAEPRRLRYATGARRAWYARQWARRVAQRADGYRLGADWQAPAPARLFPEDMIGRTRDDVAAPVVTIADRQRTARDRAARAVERDSVRQFLTLIGAI
jgi:hypothetical protein